MENIKPGRQQPSSKWTQKIQPNTRLVFKTISVQTSENFGKSLEQNVTLCFPKRRPRLLRTYCTALPSAFSQRNRARKTWTQIKIHTRLFIPTTCASQMSSRLMRAWFKAINSRWDSINLSPRWNFRRRTRAIHFKSVLNMSILIVKRVPKIKTKPNRLLNLRIYTKLNKFAKVTHWLQNLLNLLICLKAS